MPRPRQVHRRLDCSAVAAAWDPANPLTSNDAGDKAYLDSTRYNVAKAGLAAAVSENAGSTYRWGLIRLRQKTPAWRVAPNCDKPVTISAAAQSVYRDVSPCARGRGRPIRDLRPSVAAPSYGQTSAPRRTVMITPASATAASLVTLANRAAGDNAGFVPAGRAAWATRTVP